MMMTGDRYCFVIIEQENKKNDNNNDNSIV